LDTDGDGTVDIPGYGFQRFEDYSGSGFSDIEIGLRYQYLNTPNWRLAFTGGVRLPTGDIDDPDNLTDIPFGSGAWALLFRLNNDYTGIEKLVLNATLKYDLVLPDSATVRVPEDPNQPITANKEKVHRNQGDIFEIELSGTYQFLQSLSLSLLYDYSFALKDSVSGDMGYAYDSLEDESDWTAHYFTIGLNYSTIPLYAEKKFPIPMTASIEYENWFAGSNNILKQQLFNFVATFFF
ncbi:MAG: transporter, partial [Desulfobacterales bacterium]